MRHPAPKRRGKEMLYERLETLGSFRMTGASVMLQEVGVINESEVVHNVTSN
jgi:hypothetical protein